MINPRFREEDQEVCGGIPIVACCPEKSNGSTCLMSSSLPPRPGALLFAAVSFLSKKGFSPLACYNKAAR
jgi:hypothetical protein